MIHILQVLCGPARHCIMATLYRDSDLAPEDAMNGLKALIEMEIDYGMLNRRCEVCGEDKKEFWYEDGVTKEQDWEKALAQSKELEARQMLTRSYVQAQRRAGRN